ncbi:MAG TPA: DUF1707 domain-containing protein [Propionibacteriaceae bacterium]|jgi:hypothetical protein|nr:DUF1707 domain-containing protein [Propionibacteriaceae bacterium]
MGSDSQDAGRFWSSFGRDPRVRDNQGLRAGDRDRDIVREAVSEAYADGRLTRDEMDARLTEVQETRLLGDLLPIVADLMPTRETESRSSLVYAGQEEINRRALAQYYERRRQALAGMLVPSLVCLTIWIWSMISTGDMIFPWPLFVIIGTGGYLSRLVIGRESAIEEEREKIRKKQARSLALQQERDAEPSDRPDPAIGSTGAPRAHDDEAPRSAAEDDLRGDPDQERHRDQWR